MRKCEIYLLTNNLQGADKSWTRVSHRAVFIMKSEVGISELKAFQSFLSHPTGNAVFNG